jgi:ribose-phosphate pyrophosphokinase
VVHRMPREDVRGKNLIVIDDMIDTATTLTSAVEKLDEAGANRIIVAATHGLFSGDALSKIANSAIKQVIITDTLPMDRADEALRVEPDQERRLRILPIAPILGRALVEIVTNGSVSQMFKGYEQYS